ncbi:hypothetical protein [Ottowia testudinis]|uniref:DUF5666 domain-containing protein n=1 Tax=Ottowia testudinis TaxID=2816950 RepID=A0A975CGY4_9BURK|nr:hypothetical protein [Ottowia testudinis]QTD43979.1 hypothetical protein J1M35_12600 [Ottowia testudinis]
MAWIRKISSGAMVALVASSLLTGCGGGGGDVTPTAPSAPAARAAVYSGPITGFGSVIVNGVRFDTVGARLTDDDDTPIVLQDLALGMVVTIDGSVDEAAARGSARTLSLMRGSTGPITTIDLAGQTFTLLGLSVKTKTPRRIKTWPRLPPYSPAMWLKCMAPPSPTTPCWPR